MSGQRPTYTTVTTLPIANDLGIGYWEGGDWRVWWFAEPVASSVREHLLALARAEQWAELRATLLVMGANRRR